MVVEGCNVPHTPRALLSDTLLIKPQPEIGEMTLLSCVTVCRELNDQGLDS